MKTSLLKSAAAKRAAPKDENVGGLSGLRRSCDCCDRPRFNNGWLCEAHAKAAEKLRARRMYDEAAKERQKRKPDSVVENLPQQNEQHGKARDAVGKAVGVSGKKRKR